MHAGASLSMKAGIQLIKRLNMRKHHLNILIILFILPLGVFSQKSWSLEDCIQYAHESNIQIKQWELNTKVNANNLNQAKQQRLPGLNASINQNYNFGRTLQADNTYDNENITNTNLGINNRLYLFNGFQLSNSIKKNQFDLDASLADLEKAKNDITIRIASAYLEILFAIELVDATREQLEMVKLQVEQTSKLVEAGSLPKGNLLETEAQVAREELNLVNYENNLRLAYLQLTQLLNLADDPEFKILIPTLPKVKAAYSIIKAKNIFQKAVEIRPEIQSATLKYRSNEQLLKIAKGAQLPSLSLNAGYGNNYYSNSKDAMGNEISFSKQLSNNHYQYIGLALNIPIYNNGTIKNDIKNTRFQVENSRLELENTKKELREEIETAYNNALAAYQRYTTGQRALESMEEAFRYTTEKYNLGLVNSMEYSQSKNNLIQARSEWIQSKYEFIFRTKILDFYNGVPIEL